MSSPGGGLLTTGGPPVKFAAMAEPLDPKNIDKRTAARYLAQGEVDEKAWERYLKSLPDVSEKAAQVETVMADTDDFPDDESDEE
jgi:hypothetical protein